MKTKTYNTYTFDELSDEQKEKAVENYCDINVDHDWWDYMPDTFQVELIEFDTYHGTIDITFKVSAVDTAEYIVKNHGKKCDSYIISEAFLKEYAPLQKIYDEDIEGDEIENEYKMNELEKEYKKDIANEVLYILQKEYDYLTSSEAIAETLQVNEYDFTADGKID